jgi:hypothetical protein
LHEQFPAVVFGLRANVPDVDGARITADSDGIRVGSSRILTLGPDGTVPLDRSPHPPAGSRQLRFEEACTAFWEE